MAPEQQAKASIMKLSLIASVGLAGLFLTACQPAAQKAPAENAPISTRTADGGVGSDNTPTSRANLATFDTLDFDVYSHQAWDRLGESHAENIVVTYPDGTETVGLDAHIEALKPLFVFAPDTAIREHPVRIASGDWTSVNGVMEGTFTQPMPIGNGRFAAPTGKRFKLAMSTVAYWRNGRMQQEWLFWDNASLMSQIGVSQ